MSISIFVLRNKKYKKNPCHTEAFINIRLFTRQLQSDPLFQGLSFFLNLLLFVFMLHAQLDFYQLFGHTYDILYLRRNPIVYIDIIFA